MLPTAFPDKTDPCLTPWCDKTFALKADQGGADRIPRAEPLRAGISRQSGRGLSGSLPAAPAPPRPPPPAPGTPIPRPARPGYPRAANFAIMPA